MTRRGADIDDDLIAAGSAPFVLAILTDGDNDGYAIARRVRELSAVEDGASLPQPVRPRRGPPADHRSACPCATPQASTVLSPTAPAAVGHLVGAHR